MKDLDLYFITDSVLSRKSVKEDVLNALSAGVKVVQFREKSLSDEEFRVQAIELKKICDRHSAMFVVNDRYWIAKEIGAKAVHLGQDSSVLKARKILGKKAVIGKSTHSLKQAILAKNDGVDYISVGSIFPTTSKQNAVVVGVDLIKEVKKSVFLPLVAIGGIKLENIEMVINAGADAVAMISGIVASNDVGLQVQKARQIINECREKQKMTAWH